MKEVHQIIPRSKKESEDLAEKQKLIAKELAIANNQYRDAKRAIEGAAKSEELFNEVTDKTNKTLGTMQRELMGLRNTPFDGLSEADARAIKQRMADLTADIQDYKNEIKGLDTGEIFANAAGGLESISALVQSIAQTARIFGSESRV